MGQKSKHQRRRWAWATFALPLLMFGLSNAAKAQSSSGSASTAVIEPLTVVKLDDLDMGRMLPGTSGGTVTLNVNGARTTTGSVILVGTDFHVARFAGRGAITQRAQIRLPNNVTLTSPLGATMRLDNFKYGPDANLTPTYTQIGNSPNIRITGTSGIFGFVVGADLTVAANQLGGVYSGTFDVTVNYQ